jgi:hypothetical protein
MKNNFHKILNELSYRVSTGIPDLTNEQHLMKLWDILKEHNWNIDARVELLKRIDEQGKERPCPICESMCKHGETSKKTGCTPASGQASQVDTSQTSTSVDSVEIKPEEAPEKNKKLDQEKANKATEEFNEGKLSEDGVSDEDFENNSEITKVDKPIDIKEIEELLPKPLPFPKKYLKVLHRLLNTKNQGKISISDFTDAAGGGTLESTAGEIVSMALMSIDDDEKANDLVERLVQHTSDNKIDKNNKGILDPSWVKSAQKVREGIRGRYDRMFGEGKWKLKNAAWDIKEEVEALGMEDYSKDKGFSTDVYFTVEVDGETLIDEVSLKKDKKANLLNATSGRVDDIIIRGKATPEEYERYDSLYSKLKSKRTTAEKEFMDEIREKYYTDEIPDNVKVSKVKQRQRELHEEVLSDNSDAIRKDIDNFLSMSEEDQLKSLQDVGKKLNQSNSWPKANLKKYREIMEKVKNTEGTLSLKMIGDMIGTKKARANQKTSIILQSINPESQSRKDFEEKVVKNSHDHANATAKYLLENDDAKAGLLKSIREDFPLQALMSGEESMSLGDLSADQGTLREIFGVKDFKELEQNLKVREKPEPASIVFSVEGQEDIAISEINTRPDGIGYGDTWKLEMALHPELADLLETAKEVR